VLGLLVINLLAAGFVAFKVATASSSSASDAADPSGEVTGLVVALDPLIVNLDEPGTWRYLRITLELELMPEVGEEVIVKNKQMIRDTILRHLSGLRVKDTLGAEAKAKIRTHLMIKLTKLMPDKIRRMFFQEFVVQ